jgi:hypothetical protein
MIEQLIQGTLTAMGLSVSTLIGGVFVYAALIYFK